MIVKCSNCDNMLSGEDIVDREVVDYLYECRGELYSELEDVPSGRRDEAVRDDKISIIYECL